MRARHGSSGDGKEPPEIYGQPLDLWALPRKGRCVVFHATKRVYCQSIERLGLLPGGLSEGSRDAVYMTLDFTDARTARPGSDVVYHLHLTAFAAPGARAYRTTALALGRWSPLSHDYPHPPRRPAPPKTDLIPKQATPGNVG